jgi:hypothetical protein
MADVLPKLGVCDIPALDLRDKVCAECGQAALVAILLTFHAFDATKANVVLGYFLCGDCKRDKWDTAGLVALKELARSLLDA